MLRSAFLVGLTLFAGCSSQRFGEATFAWPYAQNPNYALFVEALASTRLLISFEDPTDPSSTIDCVVSLEPGRHVVSTSAVEGFRVGERYSVRAFGFGLNGEQRLLFETKTLPFPDYEPFDPATVVVEAVDLENQSSLAYCEESAPYREGEQLHDA